MPEWGEPALSTYDDATLARRAEALRTYERRRTGKEVAQEVGFVLLVVLTGLGLMRFGAEYLRDEHVLQDRGVQATAVVEDVRFGKGGGSLTVRFTTADGRQVRTTVDRDGIVPSVGQALPVVYDPADPEDARRAGKGAAHRGKGIGWMIAGALFLGMPAVFRWLDGSTRRSALRTLEEVQAEQLRRAAGRSA